MLERVLVELLVAFALLGLRTLLARLVPAWFTVG